MHLRLCSLRIPLQTHAYELPSLASGFQLPMHMIQLTPCMCIIFCGFRMPAATLNHEKHTRLCHICLFWGFRIPAANLNFSKSRYVGFLNYHNTNLCVSVDSCAHACLAGSSHSRSNFWIRAAQIVLEACSLRCPRPKRGLRPLRRPCSPRVTLKSKVPASWWMLESTAWAASSIAPNSAFALCFG